MLAPMQRQNRGTLSLVLVDGSDGSTGVHAIALRSAMAAISGVGQTSSLLYTG